MALQIEVDIDPWGLTLVAKDIDNYLAILRILWLNRSVASANIVAPDFNPVKKQQNIERAVGSTHIYITLTSSLVASDGSC